MTIPYAVKLRRRDEKVKFEFQDKFWIIVQAKSTDEVLAKIAPEYPNHDVVEIGESMYTAIL